MASFYLSYLRAFRTYANSLLNSCTEFTQIGKYASLLTAKANELIARAALNKKINLVQLQKEMYESGGICIRKFSLKFKRGVSGRASAEDHYYFTKNEGQQKIPHSKPVSRERLEQQE